MIVDIVLIVFFVFMMLYGYKKGCIEIVAKLASLIVAVVLAYFLAETVGDYIADTHLGKYIATSIEDNAMNAVGSSKGTTIFSVIQEKLKLKNEVDVVKKIIDYAFIGIGFIAVFIVARIVLYMAQSVLENIFELPLLKTFNKLGGVIAAGILFVIEISILLAIIKTISTLSFMNGIVRIIQSSVITKELYDHNIFTSLILSKII